MIALKKINLHLSRLSLVLILYLLIETFASPEASAALKTGNFQDSILVKASIAVSAGKIKLFSNYSGESLLFSARGDQKKIYQFFLFDMSGKLVSQAQIRNAETITLPKPEKGNYMFEVFSNDDRIEYGSIVVK